MFGNKAKIAELEERELILRSIINREATEMRKALMEVFELIESIDRANRTALRVSGFAAGLAVMLLWRISQSQE